MSKVIALALALCLFYGAMAPEIQAQDQQTANTQEQMTAQAEAIIAEAAQSTGLLTSFGNPAWVMESNKNQADILVEFQHGPLPDLAAAEFGLIACARIAQNHVISKSPIRRLGLTITSPLPDGRMRVYGTAIYNGNLAALIWENAGLNLDTAAAPKISKEARAKALARAENPQPKPVQKTTPKAEKPTVSQKSQPAQPVEEIVEEEVVVIEPVPGKKQAQREVQKYPEHLTPGAIRPKAKTKPETNCPYLQSLATPNSKPRNVQPAPGMMPPPPCPYLEKQIPGMVPPPPPLPALKCPYLQGLYKGLQKGTPNKGAKASPAERPSAKSMEDFAQAVLNATADELGLQEIFGNPAYTLEVNNNRQANMMVQFHKGPLPEEAALAYGLSACENLARASVVKNIGVNNIAITVTCLLPNGGMNIYGTAVFNNKSDEIKWIEAGMAINPGPGEPAVPPLPYIGQQAQPQQQPAQRRPLNVQRAPQNLKPAIPPAPQQTTPAQEAVPKTEQQAAPKTEQAPVKPSEPKQEATAPKQESPKAEQDQQLNAKTPKEQALDNANEANQATYSFEARQIINSVVRAIGLQSTYGLPEYSIIAGDKKADIDIIFKRGPMPDSSAASFGLMACEQLARACIIKGLNTRHLNVTVSYVMEDGRRYDYGTAVFNGNLDNLAWMVINRII